MKNIITSLIILFVTAGSINAQMSAFTNGAIHSVPGAHGPGDGKEVVGSRNLLDDYYKGMVVNQHDSIIEADVVFNYDKMTGSLLMKNDKQEYYTVDDQNIRSFTLKAPGKDYIFEKVPAVNDHDFLEVLAKGNNFSVYKLVRVSYKKSNYHTDGLTETGNKYDEYVDESKYFLLNNNSNSARQFELKKHSITEIFGQDKAAPYFATHKNDKIDEQFLAGLAASVNQ